MINFIKMEKIEIIRSFLLDISKEKRIPIDRLIIGEINKDLYVWEYNSGLNEQDQFKVISIYLNKIK